MKGMGIQFIRIVSCLAVLGSSAILASGCKVVTQARPHSGPSAPADTSPPAVPATTSPDTTSEKSDLLAAAALVQGQALMSPSCNPGMPVSMAVAVSELEAPSPTTPTATPTPTPAPSTGAPSAGTVTFDSLGKQAVATCDADPASCPTYTAEKNRCLPLVQGVVAACNAIDALNQSSEGLNGDAAWKNYMKKMDSLRSIMVPKSAAYHGSGCQNMIQFAFKDDDGVVSGFTPGPTTIDHASNGHDVVRSQSDNRDVVFGVGLFGLTAHLQFVALKDLAAKDANLMASIQSGMSASLNHFVSTCGAVVEPKGMEYKLWWRLGTVRACRQIWDDTVSGYASFLYGHPPTNFHAEAGDCPSSGAPLDMY